jgi:hypothetical protein
MPRKNSSKLTNGVKLSGSFDDKTFEYITNYSCKKCGATNELREELPSKSKRTAFRKEAESHNCSSKTLPRQFDAVKSVDDSQKGRKDIYG